MSALPLSPPPAHARPQIAGLYAVTPDLDDTGLLVALVHAALRGGATLVQYRNKTADAALRAGQAGQLAALCDAHRRALIVNDHVDLALAIDGAGLHVGADDLAGDASVARLRERLGADRVLGVSCYRSLALARAAAAGGADYVAFGSVFASATKPAAAPAELALFAQARGLGVPLVGIGGITRANLASLIDAGCDAAAVIGDLFASREPETVAARARALVASFDASSRPSP